MCKTYKVLPDSKFIVEMDPVLKLWLFNNWLQDQDDDVEITKNHAYLLGSFINPEAISKILGDSNKFESTDEDFDKSSELVRKGAFNTNNNIKKRRRKKIRI